MNSLPTYLNPIRHFGNRRYSIVFPFITLLLLSVLSEFFSYQIAHNPLIVGEYIIFLHIALIIYFAFRDGIRGASIVSTLAIAYYFYIIYTRHYTGQQLTAGLQTTVELGAIYYFLGWIIGWLRQTIDNLIEREADEKRRLQAILEQLPVGVVITDKDGYIVQVNKQIDHMLGSKLPIGYQVGKNTFLRTTKNGKELAPSHGPLAQALSTGKSIVDDDITVFRKDGKKVHLQTSASLIHNNAGKVIAAASITNNITQQKELERRKDDFVNMASHELKTPITSMKLYLETLIGRMDANDEEHARQIVSRITYQTGRLQELVSDLLDVSRINTGKLTFNKETFSLKNLVAETVQGLQGASKGHKLTFSGTNHVQVVADKFRIYQVLTSLISNAIKYSPKGGPITVRLQQKERKAIVSVQDTGIGIAKEQQKMIFDRLYQVNESNEKMFPGLGMGLYISKEIIKRHRGTIWVESEEGKGSTFSFSLPIHKPKSS